MRRALLIVLLGAAAGALLVGTAAATGKSAAFKTGTYKLKPAGYTVTLKHARCAGKLQLCVALPKSRAILCKGGPNDNLVRVGNFAIPVALPVRQGDGARSDQRAANSSRRTTFNWTVGVLDCLQEQRHRQRLCRSGPNRCDRARNPYLVPARCHSPPSWRSNACGLRAALIATISQIVRGAHAGQ